jgi:hypothetical protein
MDFRLDFHKLFGAAADKLFTLALTQPATFHGGARPLLQGQAEGDIAKAQVLALEGLHTHLHVLKRQSDKFLKRFNDDISYAPLMVPVAGKQTTPVGTAAGLDPDATGLEPLSHLYGVQIPGPVSCAPQQYDHLPFQEDSRRDDLYVPAIGNSQGMYHFIERLQAYRASGGNSVILPALQTAAISESPDLDPISCLMMLAGSLVPFADGFVWTPAIQQDQTTDAEPLFREAARALRQIAPDKLILVEMPAFEAEAEQTWLQHIGGFLRGGGDGIVAVRGRVVPREKLPQPDNWPYELAVQCGASLARYRQTAIESARRAFPKCFIAACGGFHRREEAFSACEFANIIVENEAFTRFGPGIAIQLLHKLTLRLRFLVRDGQIPENCLWSYQQTRWKKLTGAPTSHCSIDAGDPASPVDD